MAGFRGGDWLPGGGDDAEAGGRLLELATLAEILGLPIATGAGGCWAAGGGPAGGGYAPSAAVDAGGVRGTP